LPIEKAIGCGQEVSGFFWLQNEENGLHVAFESDMN
jgi:hypothetical protein